MTSQQAYENYNDILTQGLQKIQKYLDNAKTGAVASYSQQYDDASTDYSAYKKTSPTESDTVKAMAYSAYGNRKNEILQALRDILDEYNTISKKAALAKNSSLAKAAFSAAKIKLQQLKTELEKESSTSKNQYAKALSDRKISNIYSAASMANKIKSSQNSMIREKTAGLKHELDMLTVTAPENNKNNTIRIQPRLGRWY